MIAEYLDRGSLVARMEYYKEHTAEESGEHYAYSVALREIRNAPAADVAPVVRCKDCIYTRKLYGGLVCKYGTCSGGFLREDFFCANGTRKETRKNGDSDALD